MDEPEKYGIGQIVKECDFGEERETHMLNFFYGFMEYIRSHSSPLDFFSWHSYANVEETVVMAGFIRRSLDEYGCSHAKSFLTEWNNGGGIINRGTALAAARAAAMMLDMHDTDTDILNYYDARIGLGDYGIMFSLLDYRPENLYYCFKAFGDLYDLGSRVLCKHNEEAGFYVIADAGRKGRAVMMVNSSDSDMKVSTDMGDGFSAYLVDKEHFLDRVELCPDEFVLKSNRVLLLKDFD